MRRKRLGTYLRRSAFHQGVLGGRRGWLVVFILLAARRSASKVIGRQERFVALEKLQPGQSIQLTALRPPTRRERRSASKA